MHYRNGREAKNGDTIVQLGAEGKIIHIGVLYNAVSGNNFCNGNIAPVQNVKELACMVDCLHIDDVAKILDEHKLAIRPADKYQ